jgi:hypothetical protein
VNYWDEQMGQVMSEAMSTPFDLVLGRKTYACGSSLSSSGRENACSRTAPSLPAEAR